jgi:hypothetical protein
MAVGGFIVFFSVITSALSTCGVTGLFGHIFEQFGISYTSGLGLGIGLLEMTLGPRPWLYLQVHCWRGSLQCRLCWHGAASPFRLRS